MTRDEAVALVQQVLGFRTDLTAAIIRSMKLAQSQLELGPTKPWFLLSEENTTTTSVDEHRVELPADFLSEDESSCLVYVPDDVTEDEVILGKRDLDYLLKKYPSVYDATSERTPVYYALRGNYFHIFPKPDAAYTLRMSYYKKDALLDSNIENEWLKHVPYMLIGKTGLILTPGIRDAGALRTFTEWEREGRITLVTRNEERDHTGRDDYAMGGEE